MRQGHCLVTLLAESAEIDFGTCDPEIAKRVIAWASQFWDAHRVWSRPREVEESLEVVRRNIRNLRASIEKLDESALSIARAWHFRANRPTPDPMVRDPGNIDPDDGQAIYEWFAARFPSKEEWVDIATLRQLDALERALVRPAEIAIGLSESTPAGRGRPPELAARAVALMVARALLDLTGKVPTYRRDGTAYARLTAAIFEFLGERADTDRACKWALTKLPDSA